MQWTSQSQNLILYITYLNFSLKKTNLKRYIISFLFAEKEHNKIKKYKKTQKKVNVSFREFSQIFLQAMIISLWFLFWMNIRMNNKLLVREGSLDGLHVFPHRLVYAVKKVIETHSAMAKMFCWNFLSLIDILQNVCNEII